MRVSKQMGALVAVVLLSMMSLAARATSIPPTLAVSASTKQLHFSWPIISGATSYRLMQGSSDSTTWTSVGATLSPGATSASVDIAVDELDWVNALYRLDVCSGRICYSLPPVSVTTPEGATWSMRLDAAGWKYILVDGRREQRAANWVDGGEGRNVYVGAAPEVETQHLIAVIDGALPESIRKQLERDLPSLMS